MPIAVIVALVALLSQTAEAQSGEGPRPRPAVPAVLAAFEHFPLVGLGMSHRLRDEADLAVAIVRDPHFARTVNAVVVECGNPLYQAEMDQYVGGGEVPLERLQRFWRNTTQPGLCDPPQYKALVDAVRDVNRPLPEAQRIRLLAGDPPIDWDHSRTLATVMPYIGQRDAHFASVVEGEVLTNHRKALLVIGIGHLFHHAPNSTPSQQSSVTTAAGLIERSYPHSVFVIAPHDGFGDRTRELEPRLASWPIPSLAVIDGTWLGQLGAGVVFGNSIRRFGLNAPPPTDPFPGMKLQDLVDAYLYLGPAAALRNIEDSPPADSTYARELERRRKLIFGGLPPLPTRPPA